MSQRYFAPVKQIEFSEDIKKSRFITYLAPASNREEANAFIAQLRLAHPQARHHCWAFVAGAPTDSQCLGFSDDGEPSGTAGRPMLAQLQGSGLGEIVAVSVRYYGGVKLGTGGLVKAYGGGVAKALPLLELNERVSQQTFALACDYAMLSSIERLIASLNGSVQDKHFAQQVQVTLSIPADQQGAFERQLQDMGRGQINLLKRS